MQLAFSSFEPLNLIIINDDNLDLNDPTWCVSLAPNYAVKAIVRRRQRVDAGSEGTWRKRRVLVHLVPFLFEKNGKRE
jgi:hypothetical protein